MSTDKPPRLSSTVAMRKWLAQRSISVPSGSSVEALRQKVLESLLATASEPVAGAGDAKSLAAFSRVATFESAAPMEIWKRYKLSFTAMASVELLRPLVLTAVHDLHYADNTAAFLYSLYAVADCGYEGCKPGTVLNHRLLFACAASFLRHVQPPQDITSSQSSRACHRRYGH
jgi:hypothetical protein